MPLSCKTELATVLVLLKVSKMLKSFTTGGQIRRIFNSDILEYRILELEESLETCCRYPE
ncbi:hypothetical protein ACH5RR_006673, partial [Cinchona calisaya]